MSRDLQLPIATRSQLGGRYVTQALFGQVMGLVALRG
jgi:hypothetical protein